MITLIRTPKCDYPSCSWQGLVKDLLRWLDVGGPYRLCPEHYKLKYFQRQQEQMQAQKDEFDALEKGKYEK
jgi:hypothetical protein